MKSCRAETVVRSVVVVLVMGILPVVAPTRAHASTPTTGSLVGYGMLSAPGFTTSPPGSTPDISQWQTWPARNWQLWSDQWSGQPCVADRLDSTKETWGTLPSLCSLYVNGVVFGWCDLSKAQGTHWYAGYEGVLYDPSPVGMKSVRWTGVGATLFFTADLDAWGPAGQYGGTLAGTVTLLGTGTIIDLCLDPDGVQSPIPVLIDFHYVLQ